MKAPILEMVWPIIMKIDVNQNIIEKLDYKKNSFFLFFATEFIRQECETIEDVKFNLCCCDFENQYSAGLRGSSKIVCFSDRTLIQFMNAYLSHLENRNKMQVSQDDVVLTTLKEALKYVFSLELFGRHKYDFNPVMEIAMQKAKNEIIFSKKWFERFHHAYVKNSK